MYPDFLKQNDSQKAELKPIVQILFAFNFKLKTLIIWAQYTMPGIFSSLWKILTDYESGIRV